MLSCPKLHSGFAVGARLGPQNTSLVSQEPDVNPLFPEVKCKCTVCCLLRQINNPFPSSSQFGIFIYCSTHCLSLKKKKSGGGDIDMLFTRIISQFLKSTKASEGCFASVHDFKIWRKWTANVLRFTETLWSAFCCSAWTAMFSDILFPIFPIFRRDVRDAVDISTDKAMLNAHTWMCTHREGSQDVISWYRIYILFRQVI